MPKPGFAIDDRVLRKLLPCGQEPDEALLTIVCESLRTPHGETRRGAISMRLLADTTPAQARALANTLQASLKGQWHLQPTESGTP